MYQRPRVEFMSNSSEKLVKLKPSDQAAEIFKTIVLGKLFSQTHLMVPLEFGSEIDAYYRFLRDSMLSLRKREVGTYLLIGHQPRENFGDLYAYNKLESGTFGQIKLKVPGKKVMDDYQATTWGKTHTHPNNPPWHHQGDTWKVSYDSRRYSRYLSGGTVEFETIITPNNAGLIMATEEARQKFKQGGVSYRLLEFNLGEQINQILEEKQLERQIGAHNTVNVKLRARMILTTQWYGQMGMAIFGCSNIDNNPMVFDPIDPSGTPQEYFSRLNRQGLLGEPLSSYLL